MIEEYFINMVHKIKDEIRLNWISFSCLKVTTYGTFFPLFHSLMAPLNPKSGKKTTIFLSIRK